MLQILAVVVLVNDAIAQNVGIGTNNPTRAKLEVHGVAEPGNTVAIFGGESSGVSIMRNFPAIGFNMYNHDASLLLGGRYLATGYVSMMRYINNDNTNAKGLEIYMYPYGTAGNVLPTGTEVLSLSNSGRLRIKSTGTSYLSVGNGAGANATAIFRGTTHHSIFNSGTEEHTYIRGGLNGSKVYLHDASNGYVIFGNGNSRVAINYNNPVYTLEIRQVAGSGIMINDPNNSNSWEWYVGTGATVPNLYLRYDGSDRAVIDRFSGALTAVSDGRMKEDYTGLGAVMPKLMQLRPVTYEMIHNNPTHLRSLGFIAQEVAQLFPQLVTRQDKEEDMAGLNYGGFGVIAIKGIQEEQRTLDEMAIKILAAEKELKQLEALKQLSSPKK